MRNYSPEFRLERYRILILAGTAFIAAWAIQQVSSLAFLFITIFAGFELVYVAATYGVEGETLDHLLIAADQAMYRAKSNHKLDKISKRSLPSAATEFRNDDRAEIDTDNLASVSIN